MKEQEWNSSWQRAVSFAARVHAGQFRKDGRTPYAAHPFRVAMIVRHLFGIEDETALAVALLHDTIEDTTTDYEDLKSEFGAEVADSVAALTKDARLPAEQREAVYDRVLSKAAWQARLVKLADVYDNVCDSGDDQRRQKAMGKAYRAIVCAGDDPRLQQAVRVVQDLIG